MTCRYRGCICLASRSRVRHIVSNDVLNRNEYQSEDESDELMVWLADTFFKPDTVELANMFSRAMQRNLTLGGMSAGDELSIRTHLQTYW